HTLYCECGENQPFVKSLHLTRQGSWQPSYSYKSTPPPLCVCVCACVCVCVCVCVCGCVCMLQLALYGVACERRLSCSLRADCEIGCEMVQSTGDTLVFLSVSLFQRIGAALFNLSL